MEDGENGAKHLWNGYPNEQSLILSRKIYETNEKVLESGREKTWRGGKYTVLQDFSRQTDFKKINKSRADTK